MSESESKVPQPAAAPSAGNSHARLVEASDDVVSDFVNAVNSLGADSRYLLSALAEFARTLAPVTPSELSDEQRTYLVDSGTFTETELASSQSQIARGSFQLDSLEWWLSEMITTLSFEDTVAFLGRDEEEIHQAVAEGRLCAVDVSGRLRFPMFQFSLRSPGKVLPHLDALLPAMEERWNWLGMSRFLATRQEGLIQMGWKSPIAWLEDGGDSQEVLNIVRSGGPAW